MISRFRTPAAIIVFLAILSLSVVFAWYKSVYTFQFGDQALFHAFGKWINQGETYIADFVHFRTPGGYYHVALMQNVLGETFRATSFALILEGQAYQALAAFVLALAASYAVLGRASYSIALLASATFLAMTPIFQLRTAMPALALAAYLVTTSQLSRGSERLWGIGAGLLLGLSYWFGQEVFILLAWTIFWIEAVVRQDAPARRLERLVLIGSASLIVILLGIGGLAARGMPVSEYLYYTLPYAFLIQPTGMDTPFPPLSWDNVLFYGLFALLASSAAVIFCANAAHRPAALALLSYAILRFISALGRADYLHLVFCVSEVVVLLPITIALGAQIRWQARSLVFACLAAVLVLCLFAAAIRFGSSCLLLAAPTLAFLARAQKGSVAMPPRPSRGWMPASALLGAAAMVAIFYPYSISAFQYGLSAMRNTPSAPLIGGVQFDARSRNELRDVEAFFADHPPHILFSFPIRPEFYSYADSHATRLTYLEPQTTEDEVAGVIADLESNPPNVVVQDMGQVLGMRSSLYPIADYVASHCETVRLSTVGNLLELRVPAGKPRERRRLIDRYSEVAALNAGKVGFAMAESGSAAPKAMVLEARSSFSYALDLPAGWVFRTALDADPAYAPGARIELKRGQATIILDLHREGGEAVAVLPNADGPVTITVTPEGGSVIGLVDPRFEAP